MTWKRPKSGMWAGLVFGLALVVVVLLSPLPVLAPAILSGASPPVNVTSPILPNASSGATTALDSLLAQNPALAAEYGVLPASLQARAQQAYTDGMSGDYAAAEALLRPASAASPAGLPCIGPCSNAPAWQGSFVLGLGLALIGICAIAGWFSAGMACLVAGVVYGLVVVGLLVYDWITGGTQVNPAFADGLVEMRTIAGATDNAIIEMGDAVASFMSAVNLTLGALETSAAGAALAQLGSPTFDPAVDLNASGILSQFSQATQGWASELGAIVLASFSTMENLFGASGFYGSRGVVCPANTYVAVLTTPTTGDYSSEIGAVNQSGGVVGPGICWGSGSTFNAQGGVLSSALQISGNALNVTNGGSATTNATYLFGPSSNLTVVAVYTAGYTGLGVVLTSLDTGKNYSVATTLGTSAPITRPLGVVPAGVYQVSRVYACKAVGAPNCATPYSHSLSFPNGHAGDVLGATNIMLANLSQSGTDQWPTFNLLTPYAGAQYSNLAVACGTDTANGNTTGIGLWSFETFGTGTHPVAFTTCPTAIALAPTELGTLENVSAKFAQAYWAFLRSQGYTSEGSVPPACVFPTIANIFSPSTSPTELAQLTPTEIQALYLAYLRQLAVTFGAGLNATAGTFCGKHLPTPPTIGFGVPTVAVGNIMVPPVGAQGFPSPTHWSIANVSMLLSPTSGSIYIPVNQTWEAPKVNPIGVYYGSINLRVNSTKGSVANFTSVGSINVTKANAADTSFSPTAYLSHFTGNSSNVGGSVYPTNTSGSAGGAIFLTGCFVENVSSGAWSAPANCPFTVNTISWEIPPLVCLILGNCNPIPPAPPTTVSCPGDTYLGIFGQLLDGIAGVFSVIPVVGTTIGCVIGWIVVLLIFALILYVAARLIIWGVRAGTGRGRRGD